MEKMYLFESYFYDKNNLSYVGTDGTYVSKDLQKLLDYGQKCYESRLKELEMVNTPHTHKVTKSKTGKSWIVNEGEYQFINSVREVKMM